MDYSCFPDTQCLIWVDGKRRIGVPKTQWLTGTGIGLGRETGFACGVRSFTGDVTVCSLARSETIAGIHLDYVDHRFNYSSGWDCTPTLAARPPFLLSSNLDLSVQYNGPVDFLPSDYYLARRTPLTDMILIGD